MSVLPVKTPTKKRWNEVPSINFYLRFLLDHTCNSLIFWDITFADFSPFIGRLSDVGPSANDSRTRVSPYNTYVLPDDNDACFKHDPLFLRAQAKKRKTGGSTSTPTPEHKENPAPTRADPAKDISDDRVDLPSSPKEGMEAPNPPNPLKATEDPDAVIIIGTSFSKPASAVLSKHVSTSSHPSTGHEISKAKLPQYEKLEFDELCSGFASRLETSYEMEKNLLHMMKNKHEVRLNAYPPH